VIRHLKDLEDSASKTRRRLDRIKGCQEEEHPKDEIHHDSCWASVMDEKVLGSEQDDEETGTNTRCPHHEPATGVHTKYRKASRIFSNASEEEKVYNKRAQTTHELNERLRNLRKTMGETFPLPSLMNNSQKLLDEIEPDSATDALFDIEEETYLITQIKDVLDELNIISSVQRQQDTVTKSFLDCIYNQTDKEQKLGYEGGPNNRAHFDEMVRAAENTYKDLRAVLDLKQKQASVSEARSARREAEASVELAEASTKLSLAAHRNGYTIVIFTLVTIVFLPLSFFTSLFGMNTAEFTNNGPKLWVYSAIMWPISFSIIFLALITAFPHQRKHVLSVLKKIYRKLRISGNSNRRKSKTSDVEQPKTRNRTSS